MLKTGLAAATLAVATAAVAKDLITTLPGLGKTATKQYSGYLDLPADSGGGPAGKHLHYWLVESEGNPATDPTVFWFNGGPGCSSLDGYFYEHGPYHVKEPIITGSDGAPELEANPYAWNQIANVVFLEAPAGVGFSYADTAAGLKHNDTSTAEDNYAALQQFYKGFPELAQNDLFIAGESYAGMYVPTLALQVLKHNDQLEATGGAGAGMPLKGILVGNGVTGRDAIPDDISQKLDVEFLFGHGLFSSVVHDEIVTACGDFKASSDACDAAVGKAHDEIGNINVYNIYGKCIMAMDDDNKTELQHLRAPATGLLAKSKLGGGLGGPNGCIDAGAATQYLKLPAVKAAIHVTAAAKDWHICGGIDYTSDFGSLLPYYKSTLIPKIRVLIFNGDVDCCVPYKGNEWWTSSLGLKVEQPWRAWSLDKQVAGYVTTYEQNFNFVTVKGAGHMVPQFRPPQALAMFTRMLKDLPFDCESTTPAQCGSDMKTEL
jgi:carboxypeptidase C (cathepsin A)